MRFHNFSSSYFCITLMILFRDKSVGRTWQNSRWRRGYCKQYLRCRLRPAARSCMRVRYPQDLRLGRDQLRIRTISVSVMIVLIISKMVSVCADQNRTHLGCLSLRFGISLPAIRFCPHICHLAAPIGAIFVVEQHSKRHSGGSTRDQWAAGLGCALVGSSLPIQSGGDPYGYTRLPR